MLESVWRSRSSLSRNHGDPGLLLELFMFSSSQQQKNVDLILRRHQEDKAAESPDSFQTDLQKVGRITSRLHVTIDVGS
ncbi:hypothetical protein CHARACLAT_031396 [Characodon lateralis]|uniref:Uncharacterized protein n=1 Tax=Characodon lateralis TaxID=208331 RepID=A0ABU7EGA6_9TELE|nr:hypothetical protein [Characodon lateralis]